MPNVKALVLSPCLWQVIVHVQHLINNANIKLVWSDLSESETCALA